MTGSASRNLLKAFHRFDCDSRATHLRGVREDRLRHERLAQGAALSAGLRGGFLRPGHNIFAVAITLTLGAVACKAAVYTPSLWKTRTIGLVLCSAQDAPPVLRDKQCVGKLAFDSNALALVSEAIAQWNATFNGHIEFKILSKYEPDAVVVAASRKGCSSRYVGYMPGQRHEVAIGPNCGKSGITHVGSVLHEFGHVVGLYHEQVRADRDDWIIVDAKKLIAIAKRSEAGRQWVFQYHRLCGTLSSSCQPDFYVPGEPVTLYPKDFGTARGDYDFGSVMAYSLLSPLGMVAIIDVTTRGFARLQQQHLSIADVGQREKLSPDDIAAINTMYP